MAWAKLLRNICQGCPTKDHSHLWPTISSDSGQLWDGMCCAVVDQVSQNHLRVWYTDVGYVALEEGLLASQKTHLTERPAFLETELPVIFLPNHVLEEAQQISGSRNLHPRTLYQSLQHMKNVDSLSNPSRLVLLEYLLHGVPLMELRSLELFPFQDGKFRSLKSAAVFLDRDHLEKRLFARDQESTIDTEQLSESSSRVLHERVEHNDPMVRYRNPQDLRSYYLKNIAAGSSDIILLDEIGASMLGLVWRWILSTAALIDNSILQHCFEAILLLIASMTSSISVKLLIILYSSLSL